MQRFKTRVVQIGKVKIGGDNPIAIQSMTNTDTLDVKATTKQIMVLQDTGCDIVRVTVQGLKQAFACEKIKNCLLQKGYDIPLVADVHFHPQAAMAVCDFVDKIRINPGNFVKLLKSLEKDFFFQKIEESFLPLIEKCKKQKKALRIGTNHGSLSDRITHLYGNTALGMVVSAMEYATIARKYEFHDLVFSMKASNPLIMIEAYKILVEKMLKQKWDYPLHLGVTEAGNEQEGVIKSSVGMGFLLLNGIGDTIRMSLTADPQEEIAPAKRLKNLYENYFLKKNQKDEFKLFKKQELTEAIFNSSFFKNYTLAVIEKKENDKIEIVKDLDILILNEKNKKHLCFPVSLKEETSSLELEEKHKIPLIDLEEIQSCKLQKKPFALFLNNHLSQKALNKLKNLEPSCLFFSFEKDKINSSRLLKKWLEKNEINCPLIAAFNYTGESDQIMVEAAAEMGSLLFENLINGIWIRTNMSFEEKYNLTFAILQACRKRITKAEFISCPGCGRTLYDIQKITKKIKEKTAHLTGLKIAIMGCIVNGPGEMADADFGIIGSGKNKVDLFLGKQCVEKNVDLALVEDKLIKLIKEKGSWKDF